MAASCHKTLLRGAFPVEVLQQGAQDSGRQAALQPVEHTPASTEPAESDAVASVKVRMEPETASGLLASWLLHHLQIICRASPAISGRPCIQYAF